MTVLGQKGLRARGANVALRVGERFPVMPRGRDFITPDDVVFIIPAVLRHRIVLSPEKEMEGATADEVISQIIQSIEIPR